MDIVFLFLTLILVIILICVFVVNRITYTTDINELFRDLILQRPSTTSYSLGVNAIDPKVYDNVSTDKAGVLTITHDPLPIDLKSKFITIQEHGTIMPNVSGNSFKVTGFDLVTFQCPPGYSGAECILDPICNDADNDVGKLKPLTYSQFNGLGLYMNTFVSKNINYSRELLIEEPTHPRIRIKCLTDNNYELQTCPNNTLLNKNLNCVPYDICEDRLNGYRHNMAITEHAPNLMDNEYYICENNKSVLTKCSNDTVFSEIYSGCITDSECFGMADDTIYIDETTYLQCNNDRSEKISCPNGVIESDGRFSCDISTCTPRILHYTGELLEYDVGEVTCDANNKPITKLCDRTMTTRVYDYEWGEKVSYTINNWPTEVYVNSNCVVPTDDIIRDTTIPLQWTKAMPTYHPFNIKTKTYDCSDEPNTKYRWDYLRKTIEPPFESNNGRELINSAAPCQTGPLDVNPVKYSYTQYPNDTPAYIVLAEHLELLNYNNLSFWPQYQASDETYHVAHVTYTTTGLDIDTQTSKIPPYGFVLPDDIESNSNAQRIDLILVGYASLEPLRMTQNYFISNGRPAKAILFDPMEDHIIYPFVDEITTSEEIEFAIDFTKITQDLTILPGLVFNEKSVTYNNTIVPITYMIFYNKPNSSTESTFSMGTGDRINITFNIADYPKLKFIL